MDAPRIVVDNRYKITAMEIMLTAENNDKIDNVFIQQQEEKIIVSFRVKGSGVEARRWELGDKDTDLLRVDIGERNILWVSWFKIQDTPYRGFAVPLDLVSWIRYAPDLVE